ncbi:MAG: secretin N-terminal domain-containing protein, partial [bacterium]
NRGIYLRKISPFGRNDNWSVEMIVIRRIYMRKVLILLFFLFSFFVSVNFCQPSDKISLDLRGVDIIELFKILSLKTGLNIVPGKSVGGRVTLFLNNVTFEDALDVILISNGLAYERKADIISVMTESEYTALYGKRYNERRSLLTAQLKYAQPSDVFKVLSNIKSEIGKLVVDENTGTIIMVDIPEKLTLMTEIMQGLDQMPVTEVFDVKYGDVKELEAKINRVNKAGIGQVEIDERTNKIIVTHLPKKMEEIKQLVSTFDEKTKQVLIEAKIIQVALNEKFERGIDWQYVLGGTDFKGLELRNSSTEFSADVLGKMKVGTIDSAKFKAVLEMLETTGKTKLLSQPRITTLNNQEAKIMVGTRDAAIIRTKSAETGEATESVQYIDVGVKLNVTPHINENDFVTMEIKPEISSVVSIKTTESGTQVPIVETSEAETSVMVKDGVSIIIGGLIKDEKSKSEQGIPILRSLPLVGILFQRKVDEIKKTEMVVFLTPHIISGEVEYDAKGGMGAESDISPDGKGLKPLEE